MKEILLTSSVLILALLALRRLFRRTISRRMQYALWALVLVRLLIPGSLGSMAHNVLTVTEPVQTAVAERLEAKGAVRHESGERAKQFYPAIEQRDAARAETESFLGKVYGGSLGLMMSAMVDSRALSRKDIDELTAILEKAGGDAK